MQVKFYTESGFAAHEQGAAPPPLPDAKHAPVGSGRVSQTNQQMTRYVVSNDGIPFRPEDWNRLKKVS